MKEKQQHGILKWITEEKETTNKREAMKGFEQGLWGEEKKNVTKSTGHSCFLSQIVRPVEKH